MTLCLWPVALGRCAKCVSAAAGLLVLAGCLSRHKKQSSPQMDYCLSLTKLLLSSDDSRTNKRLGAVHTAAAHERQMGPTGRVKNQTNFTYSHLAKYCLQ